MEIYLDVLIIENIVINYLILHITAKYARCRIVSWRILCSAALGAGYLILMLFMPEMKIYTTVLSKVILSLLMVAVAYHIKNVSELLKIIVVFYMFTFMFAGGAFAFLYFTRSEWAFWNGALVPISLTSVKWTEIFYAILLTAIFAKVFKETVLNRLKKEKIIVQLEVMFNKKAAVLNGLVDTGNSLRDPLTDMPVVVVEFNAIEDILPSEIKDIYKNNMENDFTSLTEALAETSWFSKFRLIPFSSLGKENGLLIGFKPDYIEIENEENRKDIFDVVIGIHNRALSRDKKYNALLNPDLI